MVADVVSAFTDTIEALFLSLGTGIVGLFQTLVYDPEANAGAGELTTLGTWMLIFMGFSFAIAIFYALFKKVA